MSCCIKYCELMLNAICKWIFIYTRKNYISFFLSKRPMTEECHDHRWLLPTDYMIKKRERAVFLGNRLKEYNEEYHEEKSKLASESDSLASESLLGSKQKLIRSTSIQEELRTTF